MISLRQLRESIRLWSMLLSQIPWLKLHFCLLALLQMQISWRSRKSPVAKDPYQSRDIYRSKRLSHPFCWAGNVIARFDHGRLRISAESVINIILDAISSNLHTLNFASSVSTAAGFRTVLPAFRLPTRREEERKSVIKCDGFRISWTLCRLWPNRL